jgi:carboxyl-terminal processing protease
MRARSDGPRPRGLPARRSFLAAAVLAPLVAAEEPMSPSEDPAVRQALERVASTYVEPERIDPGRMRAAAIAAAAPLLGGAALDDGVEVEGRTVPCRAPASQDLVPSLAPCLEALLAAGDAGDGGRPRADRGVLRAAMLHAALGTLDRFSGAYTGSARRNLRARFTGTGVGIGVRIGRRGGVVQVVEVYPGGGGEEAGLAVGDVLLRVAGEPVEGLAVSEVSERLQGEEGTVVDVEVARDGGHRSFAIPRRTYVRPTVEGRAGREGIAVLRIEHLSKNTPEQVAGRMQDLLREHGKIVVDLRGNTGGSMLAAAGVADLFLREGVLLEALDRDDRAVPGLRERVEATPDGWPQVPVAVLVDERTGSSAELLAAALAWHDRGLLVGERTFGKNVVQKLHEFEEADLTLKISSAYLRAARRRLPAEGLAPDVWIGEAGEPGRAGPRPGDVMRAAGQGQDPWLEVALEILERHGDPSRAAMIDRLRDDDAVAVRPEPEP